MSLQNSHQISDVKVMLVKGADGKGISNIEKTGSEGLTDIYTITYSDGTKSTFTVTNGASGGMSAEIYIVSEEGSEVSVLSPSGRTLTVEQVIGQPTLWRCLTTEFGVHTIDSVLSGDDAQVSLNVDTCKVYTVDDNHFHADITVSFPVGSTCSCGKSGETPVYATENPYTFTVHSAGTYNITATDGTYTDTENVVISTSGQTESITLSFVPDGSTVTPTDDITTWLYCADIWDKNYTTISEVLADSTTLSALIADNNAVDYLVRSTTFATDITADSTAMSYIGLNNYCANTLLADSTWCNAIFNSTYFESVLNVKVPTMTSNTTPSGVASANSTASVGDAYKGFDGNNTTFWCPNNYNSVSNAWLMYEFSSPVKCYGFSIEFNSQGIIQSVNYKIQGGDSYLTLSDTFTELSKRASFNQNIDTYPKYRLFINSMSVSNAQLCGRVAKLQFYGREDV